MPGMHSKITGVGKAVPSRVVATSEIDSRLGLPSGWIEKRTGIRERRYADEGDTASTLGIAAGRQALGRAGRGAADLDLIVVATGTPDYLFPPTAGIIQEGLGAGTVGAFDIEAACAGFVYALVSAGALISAGASRCALVVGVDLPTKLLDPTDAATMAVFGDGCGAAIVEADPRGTPLDVGMGSDGSHPEDVFVFGGGSKHPHPDGDHVFPRIQMNGREVYRNAVKAMSRIGREAGAASCDLLIMHQANQRIIDECAAAMDLRDDQVFSNVDRYGNTSAGSVSIALCEAWEQGRLHPGDRVLLIGFGAGYTWSTLGFTWTIPAPSRKPTEVEPVGAKSE